MVTAWLVPAPMNDAGLGGDSSGHNGEFFFSLFFQTNCFLLSFYAHILHRHHHHHHVTPPSASQHQQDGDNETRTMEWD
jgi:hypothetical protein